MERRTFLTAAWSAAALSAAPENLLAIPATFGPCPRTLEEFLNYIVQRRAAEALNRIDPAAKKGTVYGGLDAYFGAHSLSLKSKSFRVGPDVIRADSRSFAALFGVFGCHS